VSCCYNRVPAIAADMTLG